MFKNNDPIKYVYAISLLIIAFSVFYYLIIYIPKVREENKIEKNNEKIAEQKRIDACKQETLEWIQRITEVCVQQNSKGVVLEGCTDEGFSMLIEGFKKEEKECISNNF